MNTGARISAFAAALAVTFGTAYFAGAGVEPVTSRAEPTPAHAGHQKGAPDSTDREGPGDPAGGLQVSESGYTLDLETPRLEAERRSDLRFVVRDSEGHAVEDFRREHGKELHLIVASRDLDTYRHLHPERAQDGTWSTPADLPEAGDYRVFADFTPARKGVGNLTLGADLSASGDYEPSALPRPAATATVDGYTVELQGRLRPGESQRLRFEVRKDGKEITDLQPYLGAYGHLVALRSGDLAYLHVHPNGEPGDGSTKSGPTVSFTATAPSDGTYRLFLDFKHEGRVHTADFTVAAGGGPATGAQHEGSTGNGHGH